MVDFIDRVFQKLGLRQQPRLKRAVVGIIGGTVLLLGICLIFLPGPAVVVIPAGLAILATEFVWARRWLQKAKEAGARAVRVMKH